MVFSGSWPTGWRWGIRGAALALVLASCASCGGAAAPSPVYPRDVPFADHGSATQSGIEQDRPAIAVAVDAAALAELEALVDVEAQIGDDRVVIAAFQGQHPTGGYSIRVEAVTLRTATTLVVRAVFTEPPADAIVIQVLTSPAHVVSVARADVSGVDRVVLVDASGEQRAEVTVPIR